MHCAGLPRRQYGVLIQFYFRKTLASRLNGLYWSRIFRFIVHAPPAPTEELNKALFWELLFIGLSKVFWI